MKCPGCGRRLFINRSRCVCGYHLHKVDERQRRRKQAANALRWGLFELVFGIFSVLLCMHRGYPESIIYVSYLIMALGLFNIGFYIVAKFANKEKDNT